MTAGDAPEPMVSASPDAEPVDDLAAGSAPPAPAGPGPASPRQGPGTGRIVAAVVVVAVVVGLLVVVLAGGGGDGTPSRGQVVGRESPPLVGMDARGGRVDLAELRGRWVVVNFFATWCPPCVAEHPELVAFSERNEDDAIVISVAFDEPADVVERWFDANGGDWPVLSEDTGRIVLDYGVVRLPESFLVDPDGMVVDKLAGGVTAAELEQLISDHSSGVGGDTS